MLEVWQRPGPAGGLRWILAFYLEVEVSQSGLEQGLQ